MYTGFLCDKVALSGVSVEDYVCALLTVDIAGEVVVKGLQCKC